MAFTGPEAILSHPKSFARRTCPGMKFSNQELRADPHPLKCYPPIEAEVCLEAWDLTYTPRQWRPRDIPRPPKPMRLDYTSNQGLAGKPSVLFILSHS